MTDVEAVNGCPLCSQHVDVLAAIASALADDDLDLAIARGLLNDALGTILTQATLTQTVDVCDCCRILATRISSARNMRLSALAARERYRKRQIRLQHRAEARALRRNKAVTERPPPGTSKLPPDAAAALARAKARAAAHRQK